MIKDDPARGKPCAPLPPHLEKSAPLDSQRVKRIEKLLRDEEPVRRIGLLFLTKTLDQLIEIAKTQPGLLEETIEITLSAAERVEGIFDALMTSVRRMQVALQLAKPAGEVTP